MKFKNLIWQQPGWPNMTYDRDRIAAEIVLARRAQGIVEGKLAALGLSPPRPVAGQDDGPAPATLPYQLPATAPVSEGLGSVNGFGIESRGIRLATGRGVRIDSHVYTGYTVPPYYDSLIAKIITVGSTRINAIDRMRRALDEYYVTGIKTTVPFHAAMMRDGDFRDGNYDTGLIDRLISAGKLTLKSRPLRLHE